MRYLTHLFSSSLIVLASNAAFAEDLSDTTPETVVVTATRTLQPRDVTGESLSVITAQALNIQQTVVLSDILAETPGLYVTRTGGVGETTEISIRGSAPGQVLVLVDSVRINDPSAPDGEALLSDLLVNNTARVEVLRGPQSTLYGSQALGGVVNIISNTGGDGFSARASAEGGSYGTYRLNVATNGSYDIVDYGGALNYLNTAGIPAANPQIGLTGADSYHNVGGTFNTRTHLTDNLSFDLRGYLVDSRVEFDGYPPPNYTQQHDGEFGRDQLGALYAGINLSFFDGRLQNRIAFTGTVSDNRDYGVFDPTTYAFSPDENFYDKGHSKHFEYQGIFAVADKTQLTFGAEYERTSLNTNSLSPFFPPSPPQTGYDGISSFYAQVQTEVWDGLTMTGGVRDDDDQNFGNHVSVKVAGAWQFFDGNTVLHANFGDGFKAPTLYQLFSQYSNPVHTLAPETASGWEAGATQYFVDKNVRLSATYFDRDTRDQIEFVDCFGPTSPACTLRPIGYYDNVARSRASGVELEAAAQITDGLSLSANYTYLDAIDLSSYTVLPRQPHDMAYASLTWAPSKKWSLSASVGFTGSSYDQAEDVGHLGAFTLVNLYASYAITDQLEVFGRVDNLFDMHYETVFGYNALGRAAYGGVRLHI